jgi:SET domain-containing protein
MAKRKVKAMAVGALAIKRSKIAGRGGFAARDIRKGERIIEYLGERISHAVADDRYDDFAKKVHHTFLFAVNRRVVIDAAVNGNEARFLNHSCAANCEAVIEGSRVFIDAKQDIAKGAELCYDYAYTRDGSETDADEFGVYGCRCGGKGCRGTILAPLTKSELKKRAAAEKKRAAAAKKLDEKSKRKAKRTVKSTRKTTRKTT